MFATRLLPNGQPDPTFGTGGKATIEDSSYIGAYAAAVQPDGKVVVVGYRPGKEADTAMAWRLTANGALDETFGTGGAAELAATGSSYATAVAIAPNGKIVVAGNSFTNPSPYRVSVWRLTTRTARSTRRSTPTVSRGSATNTKTDSNAIALQPDGKILVAGTTSKRPRDQRRRRLAAEAGRRQRGAQQARDPTFDVDGQADVDAGGNDIANAARGPARRQDRARRDTPRAGRSATTRSSGG